jgi:hypothetical protein
VRRPRGVLGCADGGWEAWESGGAGGDARRAGCDRFVFTTRSTSSSVLALVGLTRYVLYSLDGCRPRTNAKDIKPSHGSQIPVSDPFSCLFPLQFCPSRDSIRYLCLLLNSRLASFGPSPCTYPIPGTPPVHVCSVSVHLCALS